MKKIQPVNVWQNGEVKSATQLDISIVSDNLEDSATFYYQLFSVDQEGNNQQVAQGNLSLSGSDYESWDGDNEWAYSWVANELSLKII